MYIVKFYNYICNYNVVIKIGKRNYSEDNVVSLATLYLYIIRDTMRPIIYFCKKKQNLTCNF